MEHLSNVFQEGSTVWMSTEVGRDGEMSPRKLIGSVGFAFKAGDVTRFVPRTTPPVNPKEGEVFMDLATHTLLVFDGTTWQACW